MDGRTGLSGLTDSILVYSVPDTTDVGDTVSPDPRSIRESGTRGGLATEPETCDTDAAACQSLLCETVLPTYVIQTDFVHMTSADGISSRHI